MLEDFGSSLRDLALGFSYPSAEALGYDQPPLRGFAYKEFARHLRRIAAGPPLDMSRSCAPQDRRGILHPITRKARVWTPRIPTWFVEIMRARAPALHDPSYFTG